MPGTEQAKIVEIIVTSTVVGDGTPENPFRTIKELWTKEGALICCVDPTGAGNYLTKSLDTEKL